MAHCFPPQSIPPRSYVCHADGSPKSANAAGSAINCLPGVPHAESGASGQTNPSTSQARDHTASPISQDPPQATSRKRQRPEGSRLDVAYPRKRAISACRLCRARKVKCNNARPSCGSCEASKVACVYEDTQDVSAFDPASILILDRLNQVLSRLDQIQVPFDGLASVIGQVICQEDTSPRTTTTETAKASTQSDARGHETVQQDQASEGQSDQLHIPSSRTNTDSILQWPIFGGRFPPNYLTDPVFELDSCDEGKYSDSVAQGSRKRHGAKISSIGIDEEGILDLVQRFLDLVHIKNPIIDVDTIWSYARSVVEDGLKWDSASCLVLLACALGCVATPFPPEMVESPGAKPTSLESQQDDIRAGEAYYNLARRRFGLLEIGIISTQCHFLAGVYSMYVMRPLPAWSQFQSAAKSYYLYLQCQPKHARPTDDSAESSKRRSVEQRLYWSCYKSECELRAEINLPNSSLAEVHYSDLHPSPPDMDDDEINPEFESSPPNRPAWSRTGMRATSGARRQQEQTWYYYLTEITLRRIANRVLNLFYTGDHTIWTKDSIVFMVKAAEQFEQQLEEWHVGLPSLIQFSDDMPPQEELPYHVRGRVLEIKMWIYTPFLYYAIHAPPDAPYRDIIQPFVDKAITYNFLMLRGEPNRHRHHGTWYAVRAAASSSLFILGAVRCGTISVPEDWMQDVRRTVNRMRYWAAEGPGVSRAIEVMESYLEDA